MTPGKCKNAVFWGLVPLCLIGLTVLFTYNPDISLLPLRRGYSLSGYSDSLYNNGNSLSSVEENSNGSITAAIELRNRYQWPYAGIDFYRDNFKRMNLSGYDYIDLEIAVHEPQEFIFLVWLAIDSSEIPITMERPVQQRQIAFSVSPEKKEYRLYLQNLETPDWWYDLHRFSQNTIPRQKLSKVVNCALRSKDQTVNKRYEFTLSKIIILSKNSAVAPATLLILLIYYTLLILYAKITERNTVVIPIQQVSIENEEAGADLMEIQHYLAKNFSDNTLSLSRIARELGIPEAVISRELKTACHTSFKQYLNRLRMEEALRLLQASDLAVKEIAFKVGYNNTSHFFRVFQRFYKKSPSDFREKK